ncbi:MAG: hypothetical protein IJD45_03315 [Clostridia bacterium]|nr:hypothetical protein [Clostridia bacterium]
MSEKRNEIMEEQRRAREEYIKLKKMQQGELQPQAKPSELAVTPKTFREKLNNFWYHYKIHTILAGFLIAVLAVSVTQCATRPKYDFGVLYFAYETALDTQTQAIADYFEKFAEDINGDGEVNINVINCSVNDSNKDPSRFTMFSKIQAILASEETVSVYVVDQKAIQYFDDALDISIFTEKPTPLGDEFYKKTAIANYTLPKDLSVGLRAIKGTTFEESEKAMQAHKAGEKFIEKIKKQGNYEVNPKV